MSILMLFSQSVPLGGFSAAAENDGGLTLEVSGIGEDMLCLSLEIVCEKALCGLLARIDYDGEMLEFLSAELADELSESAKLSYSESVGSLRFILDGEENIFSGYVAEFVFRIKKDGKGGISGFVAVPLEAYRWEDGDLLSVRMASGELVNVSYPDREGVIISGASLQERDGDKVLLLEGIRQNGCLAAGFDVTVLEVDKTRCESYRALSVMPKSGEGPCTFSRSVAIPSSGTVCIVVCPIAFCGSEAEKGGSEVFVFLDGMLVNKISMSQ